MSQSRPAIPPDMKAFNRAVIDEWRANGGKLSGRLASSQLILLTTVGATTGEPRTVVLGYVPYGKELVAIASDNGAPNDPKWYRNLLVNPTATIERGADMFQARARTARPEEREEYGKLVPYLERQQKLTERDIPIVIFVQI